MNNKGLIISILAVVLFGIIGLVIYVSTSQANKKADTIKEIMGEKVDSKGSAGGIISSVIGLVLPVPKVK